LREGALTLEWRPDKATPADKQEVVHFLPGRATRILGPFRALHISGPGYDDVHNKMGTLRFHHFNRRLEWTPDDSSARLLSIDVSPSIQGVKDGPAHEDLLRVELADGAAHVFNLQGTETIMWRQLILLLKVFNLQSRSRAEAGGDGEGCASTTEGGIDATLNVRLYPGALYHATITLVDDPISDSRADAARDRCAQMLPDVTSRCDEFIRQQWPGNDESWYSSLM